MKSEIVWDEDKPVIHLEGETFRSARVHPDPNAQDPELQFVAILKDGRGIHPFPDQPLETLPHWEIRAAHLADVIAAGRAWVEGE